MSGDSDGAVNFQLDARDEWRATFCKIFIAASIAVSLEGKFTMPTSYVKNNSARRYDNDVAWPEGCAD
jgi:hypothetical protein